jgi:hypothetical protein
MILWRLHGYPDPEGEYVRSEVVCSIERSTSGYRLLVEHERTMHVDEVHASATAAQGRAQALRAALLKQGWTAA